MTIVPAALGAQSASTPGTVEAYSTIHSIGIEWPITGDDNHNAICLVQYRKAGTTNFSTAMPLYRIDYQGVNALSGSILFLDPDTEYNVLLALGDTDGGSMNKNINVTTRAIPSKPVGGNMYHVAPGAGGGDGSIGNPFLGVTAAEAVAQPGDVFLLHAGNYGETIYFTKGGTTGNHVVWKAAGDGDPVFEGVRLEADYLWLEGLKVINQQYGLRTSPPGPEGVVVTRCTFENNHYSIFLNDGGEGWYITDNTIVGDNDPNTSNFSGEGIELFYTNNHTIAYNTISLTADGISYPGKNVDIFGNDIFDTSDDGIEFDYGFANNRAWKNRITNALNNGISFQPMDGSPYYVLYNQVSVLNENVLKLRTRSDRALIAHNTFIAKSGPVAFGSNFLVNFETKNNLWISVEDRYAWENGSNTPINWKTDWDYDGFDWGNFVYAFKWGDRLDHLSDFQTLTNEQTNAIVIDHETCIDSVDYTTDGTGGVQSFFKRYYTLDQNCNGVDAGLTLQGINDDFSGTAPDLGAYELGAALPHYGVRPLCDQVLTNKWIGPDNAFWHANTSYWSLGRFPTNCDKVLIENGTSVKIEAGQTGYGFLLEVRNGALLTTDPMGRLEVLVE